MNPVVPLLRPGSAPDQKQRFDDFAERPSLPNDEKPRTRLARCQALAKVRRHRSPIVRNHDPSLLGREFEQLRIFHRPQAGLLGVEDVDRRLAGPQAFDDVTLEVFIRQEPDGHDRFEPN